MLDNYIEIIAGALSGGTLATIFQVWRERNKDRSDEIFKVLDEYKAIITELRDVETQCKTLLSTHSEKINMLQTTITELRSKIILLESASNDLPFPMWLKDVDSKMLYLNNEYERLFLIPNGKTAKDYIGRYDHEVWSKEIADEFTANDRRVLASKSGTYVFTETIKVNGAELTNKYKVVKYLRYVGKTVVGIGGMAILMENS